MQKIKQKHYGNIEIDQREKDCIIVWGGVSGVKIKDPQCIIIDRDSLNELIKKLQDGTN